jgi:2-oxoglutarate ferredoxin oxidoreductase subunit alpha
MSEFAGLAYYAEVPGVVFDIQRVGPSTGLPTRTAQGDILKTALLSHGDTRQILLIPGTPEECYAFAMEAFDLTERFQTLVFVMSDLDLGMNTWMADPFRYPDKGFDRGKLLDQATLQRIGGQWGRYKDVDGDGIPYRTVPGDGMPAYFTRGSGHNERGQYSERPDDYSNNVDRLARKFETAKQFVPAPIVDEVDADIGIIGYGSSHCAIDECRDQLLDEAGVPTAYLRIRAYPFSSVVRDFVARHRRVYVVEQNRDAQMRALLKMDLPAELSAKLRSVLHYNGLPIDARSLSDEILMQEGKKGDVVGVLDRRPLVTAQGNK